MYFSIYNLDRKSFMKNIGKTIEDLIYRDVNNFQKHKSTVQCENNAKLTIIKIK